MINKKTKILFFHFDLQPGGAERVLVNLVNNLDPDKYNITVQTIFGQGALKDAFAPHINLRSLFKCKSFGGTRQLFKLFSPETLHRLLIRERYDIEIAFLEQIPTRIIGGCHIKGTKKFTWLHNTANPDRKLAIAARSWEEFLKTYSSFDKIAFVSEGARDSFYRHYPAMTPGSVVHNVVESDIIKAKAMEKITDLTLDKDKLNLCSVGRICGQKGYDRLFRCLERVSKQSNRSWHLYLIGEGAEHDSLVEQATEEGIIDNITFVGFRDNPYKYVSKMDLFVCSSNFEGYSTAVTESIIVGTPVITTDCSGMSEIFGNTNSGMIVENNEDALTSGLIQIFDNNQILYEMKIAAEERSFFYSKESCIKQFENFIEND